MSSGWKKRFGFKGALLTVGMVFASVSPALAHAEEQQHDKDKDKDYGGSGGYDDNDKKKVCHKGKTLEVGAPAVQAHLRHGDKYGPCKKHHHDHKY